MLKRRIFKHIFIFLILLFSGKYHSQELVNIGIFYNSKISEVKILFQDNYSIQYEENGNLFQLKKNQIYLIKAINDSLVLFDNLNNQNIVSKKINFYSPDIDNAQLTIITNHSKKERIYKGHLIVTANNGNLKMINTLNLDDYVCGVVNAEVGKGRHPEFYKAQALLVRTYALSHLYKHLAEGFNLCDGVHCQVYYGICYSSIIADAVKQTQHQVIVDNDLNLIVAAFHSNSGGQTVNSEDIWGSKKDYLRSVIDTFSIGMPSYSWKKTIPLSEWKSYLKKNKYPIDDSEAFRHATYLIQTSRLTHLQFQSHKIPLKNIRDDLKLMSTLFNIHLNATSDSVIFYGRGFGHGVGLSQEGAMKMAKLGYTYEQIIRFYYQNVLLIDLRKLNFFKEE
jgi:stage II sporulation protein D